MNARERVLAVLEGREPDQTPCMFTMHFPPEERFSEAAVQAHLRFLKATDSDVCKVMNENLLRSDAAVRRPEDLLRLTPNAEAKRGIERELDLVKRLRDTLCDAYPVFVTIHGPMVSVHHMSGRSGFFVENLEFYGACMRQAPQSLAHALAMAADTLCELVRRCIREAGADGVYLAILGAERTLFTDDAYRRTVRPYDLQVIEAARQAGGRTLLHICKKNVEVRRFLDYPVDAFNWEMTGQNASLDDALALVPEDKTVIGGLSNESGCLIEGTRRDVTEQTRRLLTRVHGRRWIVGAGCTLPGTTDLEKLRLVKAECGRFQRLLI